MSRRLASGAALVGGPGCSVGGRGWSAGDPRVARVCGGMGRGILVRADPWPDPRPMLRAVFSSGILTSRFYVKFVSVCAGTNTGRNLVVKTNQYDKKKMKGIMVDFVHF